MDRETELVEQELTADTVAELVRPTLDKFVASAEPYVRKVSEGLYEKLLWSVQDYLRENGEWNIGQEIERCRRTERENADLRSQLSELRKALAKAATRFEVCATMIAESHAVSGTLRAERTIKARHFASEALEALSQYRGES